MPGMSIHLISRLAMLRAEPRFHGNGFIQLQLNDRTRLHIWHPKLPPIPDHNATIHDHVWDMESVVLLGSLTHYTYDVREPELLDKILVDMYSVGAADKQGVGDMLGFRQALIKTGAYSMAERSVYQFPAHRFHASVAHWLPEEQAPLVATLMTKQTPRGKTSPRIVCPSGATPVDAFDEKHQPISSLMWMIIERALASMNPWALDEITKTLA